MEVALGDVRTAMVATWVVVVIVIVITLVDLLAILLAPAETRVVVLVLVDGVKLAAHDLSPRLLVVRVVGSTVDGVRVKSGLGNNVVLQQSLQVLLAKVAEEEGVDPWAKLEESKVGWSKEGATWVVSGVELLEKASLGKTELKSRELGWEKVDDLDDVWWWNEKGVNAVDNSVGTELNRWLACDQFR